MADFEIRNMTIEDYEGVYSLWNSIEGFAIRSLDDSFEGIKAFIRRNPTTSVVATKDNRIIGAILCGHDGRRACFYHVCVDKAYRRHKVGESMVNYCMKALKAEGISKVSLIAFKKNDLGNAFWNSIGWTFREDLNYYDYTLNENNVITYVEK